MAGQAFSVKVKGLRQTESALKRYNNDAKRGLESRLKDIAGLVASDASRRFSAIDVKSAAGFRPRMRGFGKVVVEQRLGRTTGLRPDFGSLQMRTALLPALSENRGKVIDALESMLDSASRQEGF